MREAEGKFGLRVTDRANGSSNGVGMTDLEGEQGALAGFPTLFIGKSILQELHNLGGSG